MIKAPLDEKNISPSQIIDDLTCCNNISEENQSVGFIEKTPALFTYSDNVMLIKFYDWRGREATKDKIRNYFFDMCENTKGLLPSIEFDTTKVTITFYWLEYDND